MASVTANSDLGVRAQAREPERGRTDEERAYYSLNRRVYSKFAPFYDLVVWPLRRVRRDVVRLSRARPDSNVLDVATGTGDQALAFADHGSEVVGVDLSEAMLGVARRKQHGRKARFLQADATELPFADSTFDVSCISFALHEMPLSVRERVLRQMVRVTRPAGTIVIVDYGLPRGPLASRLVYHAVKLYERDNYAEFVRSDLKALLERSAIRVTYDRPCLFGAVRVVIGVKLEPNSSG